MDIYTIIIAAGSAAVGCVVALLLKGVLGSKKLKNAEYEAGQIVKGAEAKADSLIKEAGIEAKDLLFKMKSDFESEAKETRLEKNSRFLIAIRPLPKKKKNTIHCYRNKKRNWKGSLL